MGHKCGLLFWLRGRGCFINTPVQSQSKNVYLSIGKQYGEDMERAISKPRIKVQEAIQIKHSECTGYMVKPGNKQEFDV